MLPNKQKLPIFLKWKMSSFRMCNTQALLATMVAARGVARRMHCLPIVLGILDASCYTDLQIIPTFPEMPAMPTVSGKKVGITK